MTDRPRPPTPTELDALLSEWHPPRQQEYRSLERVLQTASVLNRMEARLTALTPSRQARRLTDLARRTGEWGMAEQFQPASGTWVWTLGLRLPVQNGFLTLYCDRERLFQLNLPPPGSVNLEWTPVCAVTDLNPHAVFTFNPETDQQVHGHSVHFTVLHSLPDLHTLATRGTLAPPTRRSGRLLPAFARDPHLLTTGLMTSGYVLALLTLVVGIMVILSTRNFWLILPMVLSFLAASALQNALQRRRASPAGLPHLKRFWNEVELAELSALPFVIYGVRPPVQAGQGGDALLAALQVQGPDVPVPGGPASAPEAP